MGHRSLCNRSGVAAAATALFIIAGSAAAQTILPMNLSFTHRLGGLIPAHQIRLEVWEQDDVSADDFIGNYGTGNNGQATVLTNEDDGLLDSTLELYAFPRSYAVGYARVTPRAVASQSYFFRSPGGTGNYPATINALNGAVNLVPADNNTFGGAAFGILQPIVFTAQYFAINHAYSQPEIDVLYDGTATEPTTGFGGNYFLKGPNPRGASFINIDSGDWGSWDVIGHEYCHYLADGLSLSPGVGGPHTIGNDNIPNGANAAQKTTATGLAWNEGIATFMYQMGVRSGNINADFGGLLGSRDFDTWYTDFNAPGTTAGDAQVTFEYDLETIGYHTRNGANVLGQHLSSAQSRGQGEGDELPVQRVLWDLYDPTGEAHTPGNDFTGFRRVGRSDKANFGNTASFNIALRGPDNAGNKSFMQSWDDVTDYLGTAAGKAAVGLAAGDHKHWAVTRVGESLEEHTISALPTFGTTDITNPVAIVATAAADTTPRLTWTEQANGRTDIYRLLIFKPDWSIQWDSGNLFDNTVDVATNYFFDVPAGKELPNGDYYWSVLTNPDLRQVADLRDNLVGMIPNQADLFKYYWSGANAFRIIPTPGTVALLVLSGLLITRRRID